MERANAILQWAFKAIHDDADRRGFERPYRTTVTDGAGVALLTEGDTAEHSFPFTFKLTDAKNRTAELIVESPEQIKPKFVQ